MKRRGAKTLNGLKDQGRDVVDLVVRYLKQETVGPLKALGRFVVYGTVGSFVLGVGVILFLVAVLRALQEETAVFHGNLSWIPYLIVAVLGVLVIVIAGLRIAAGPARRRLPVKEGK